MTKVCSYANCANYANKSEGVVFLLITNVLETGFTSFHMEVKDWPRPPCLIPVS